MNEQKQRLADLRDLMKKHKVDWVLVRSTDEYLSEYVPDSKSLRVYITGFNGSVGDAIIGTKDAYLFVDGRYALQGRQQAKEFQTQVTTLGQSIEDGWLAFLSAHMKPNEALSIELDKIPNSLFTQIQTLANTHQFNLTTLPMVIPGGVIGIQATNKELTKINSAICGHSPKQHLKSLEPYFTNTKVDALLLTALDDIAWITNSRGTDFPFQATFAANALIFPNEICVKRAGQSDYGKSTRGLTIGFDPQNTPEQVLRELTHSGAQLVATENPCKRLKSIKHRHELDHMRESFARADGAVYKTQKWVCAQVTQKKKITESDVSDYITEQFMLSGAHRLSFKPICAAGKNGAVIHYSHPDPKRVIKLGELFLLDTGAYYEGGYATDLTRTFLVGGPATKATKQQKTLFTLVLKASIAGMSARFPKGTNGMQLDAIVRDPIWRAGYNYAHGTGHGVGINVHESPPRVAPNSLTILELGHVFSIEPGLYIEDFGGIRIENLCTLVDDPTSDNFARVLPLTFAPLDKRLIDANMLSQTEKAFLKYFTKSYRLKDYEWPALFGE